MLEAPGLAEKLAQIRQGAAQAQGGGLLQSLLGEIMKSSGRSSSVPSAGSPGTILSNKLPSVSMPKTSGTGRTKAPVKDKAAAAREYKKQQQAALKNAYAEIKKGKTDKTPYSKQQEYEIMQKHGVDENVILGTFNIRSKFEDKSRHMPITDEQRKEYGLPKGSYVMKDGKPTLIKKPEKKSEKSTLVRMYSPEGELVAKRVLEENQAAYINEMTAKGYTEKRVEAKDTLQAAKLNKSQQKELRDYAARLYGFNQFGMGNKNDKEKILNLATLGESYMTDEGLSVTDALDRAFGELRIKDIELPEANPHNFAEGWFGNEEETSKQMSKIHGEGAAPDDIYDKLINAGWKKEDALKLMEGANIKKEEAVIPEATPVVPEATPVVPKQKFDTGVDKSAANAIKQRFLNGEISREEALKQLAALGLSL